MGVLGEVVAPKPKVGSIEEKIAELKGLEARSTPEQRAEFAYRLDISWIHHDSALEGVVYEPSELVAALRGDQVTDSSLAPVYDEIRCYKAAIDLIRRRATEPKLTITLDGVREIYDTLVPDEGEKGSRYRKEMPLHRQYFHQLEQPEKISYRLRQLIQWLSEPDTYRMMHATRVAARAHHEFLHIFPYPKHSGKVARLMMNMMLRHGGYPPVILHATDRQRYYDSLKGDYDSSAEVILDALDNSIESTLRYYQRLHGLIDDD